MNRHYKYFSLKSIQIMEGNCFSPLLSSLNPKSFLKMEQLCVLRDVGTAIKGDAIQVTKRCFDMFCGILWDRSFHEVLKIPPLKSGTTNRREYFRVQDGGICHVTRKLDLNTLYVQVMLYIT